ncbi:MAG: hypothetical protein AAF673_02935 [Pseudomonadota bacterium]
MAAAASGGLSAISGVLPIVLPGSSTAATPAASRAALPRSEEELSAPPTIIIDEDIDHGAPAPSSKANSSHHTRHHSGTASIVSSILDALDYDGIVDPDELGDIVVSVLGDGSDSLDAA